MDQNNPLLGGFLQVIDELSSRLEKRESQLLTVSTDKVRLEEKCDNLRE
jgi:hypothetical protein